MSSVSKLVPGVRADRQPLWKSVLLLPSIGPLVVLLVFCTIFALTTGPFLSPRNASLILQQSVILGALAIGQTLVILTAGIDLAAGGIAVLCMIIIGRSLAEGLDPFLALALAFAVATGIGAVSGGLVSRLKLPPFIVTLGLLGIVTAVTRLLSMGSSFPIESDVAAFFGNGFTVGGARITYGMIAVLGLYAAVAFALNETWWGRHVYAVGSNPAGARLVGIRTGRTLLSVYVVAGVIYAFGAWLALGRIPSADPNALQTANLDSITAVVIGGTSLFGGRGSVVGTLIGTLIIAVLRNGLTLQGIDPLWQDLVTGVLVILAVAVDQLYRRGR